MWSCFSTSCISNLTTPYYFATYKRAFIDIQPLYKINRDIKFYEKEYYCAHIYSSTYTKYKNSSEILYHMHADTSDNALGYNEKIEKLDHKNVVVAHVYPNRSESLCEMDADEYIKSNSINHTWKGKSMVMFSKWCENVNICPVTDETRDNIIN